MSSVGKVVNTHLDGSQSEVTAKLVARVTIQVVNPWIHVNIAALRSHTTLSYIKTDGTGVPARESIISYRCSKRRKAET